MERQQVAVGTDLVRLMENRLAAGELQRVGIIKSAHARESAKIMVEGAISWLYEIIFASPRFSLITGAAYWLSETPYVPGSKSWDNSKHPRVVNWMRLQDMASGVQFRILNTHFDQKGQVAREHSADMVVNDARAFPSDFPQIFTGDLNADEPNKALDILRAGGWLDTWATLYGPGQPGFTAHDFLGSNFVAKGKLGHTGKIDWIFCRGNVTPIWSKIIRDQQNGIYPSDHYFVVAELQIQPSLAEEGAK